MSDEFWALRDDVSDDDIPVAELAAGEGAGAVRPPKRAPRSRKFAAVVLVVALLGAGAVSAAHFGNDSSTPKRKVATDPHSSANKSTPGQARADVFAALSSTTAAGSFKIHFRLSAQPAPAGSTTTTCPPQSDVAGSSTGGYSIGADIFVCGYDSPNNNHVTISGEGVVNVDPIALVTTAQAPNLGEITTRNDGTRVWEDGGANYGMAPSSNNGPGSPLSQFAGLVSGTLGRREGAVAMNGMASPTGYLDFAKDAITGSSQLVDAVVDGVPVHVYEVGIDAMKSLERPGLTAEETATTAAALKVLQAEGYASTTVRLSIDDLGRIRQAHSVVRFADGGTVTGDTTFSDFGCSTVIMLPNGPSIVPSGCAPGSPGTAPTP